MVVLHNRKKLRYASLLVVYIRFHHTAYTCLAPFEFRNVYRRLYVYSVFVSHAERIQHTARWGIDPINLLTMFPLNTVRCSMRTRGLYALLRITRIYYSTQWLYEPQLTCHSTDLSIVRPIELSIAHDKSVRYSARSFNRAKDSATRSFRTIETRLGLCRDEAEM